MTSSNEAIVSSGDNSADEMSQFVHDSCWTPVLHQLDSFAGHPEDVPCARWAPHHSHLGCGVPKYITEESTWVGLGMELRLTRVPHHATEIGARRTMDR
jgi:hypothetical protein